MEIEFYGAAGEVTGSCHVLRHGGRSVLIDCGMVQGGRATAIRNREDFPFDPQSLEAVFLTHAHIDHSGRLPLLVQRGYRGPIYTTAACRDLLPILLEDSADLALREVERTNRHREPGEPEAKQLFDLDDVGECLKLLRVIRYDTEYAPFPGMTVRLREAGHILGSASLEFELRERDTVRRIVFSGDLGQYDSPILRDPHPFKTADLIVMESTYGDRDHRDRSATLAELGEIIDRADHDRGNIVIPAFAVGRSQELLYLLGQHAEQWNLQRWQVYLDSPMAIKASEIYWRHPERYDEEAAYLRDSFGSMPNLPSLQLTRTADESRVINSRRSHALIIAGSGMCNGGRVLHHLTHNLPRAECHVIFTGYQAPGTLGRALVDRARRVNIHGMSVPVQATIHTVGGLSAHGGQHDLLRWYDNFEGHPPVCLVHGEPEPARLLQSALQQRGAHISIPHRGDMIDLVSMRFGESRSMKSRLSGLVLALAISLCALPASTFVVAAEPAAATARTVLVIGATGRTGREVVVKSLEAGYRVRALVRDELRARASLGSEVTLIVGDVRTDETIAKAVEGADFVISALGSNVRNDPSNTPELVDYGGIRRLAEKAAESKIRHFVLVSSMGATHRDHPLNRMYSNILTWKLKGEDALRVSGIPYTIVRPGGLTEARGGEFLPMMMQGDDLSRQGRIARADVAAIAVAALDRPEAMKKTFEVIASNATGQPDWTTLFGSLNADAK